MAKLVLLKDREGNIIYPVIDDRALIQNINNIKLKSILQANHILIKLNLAIINSHLVFFKIMGNTYLTNDTLLEKPINSILLFYWHCQTTSFLNCSLIHYGYNFGNLKLFVYDNSICLYINLENISYPSVFVEAYDAGDVLCDNIIDIVLMTAFTELNQLEIKFLYEVLAYNLNATLDRDGLMSKEDKELVNNLYWIDLN